MSNTLLQNVGLKEDLPSSSAHGQQKKDIIVSIILTESTSKLLKLNLPHLEELDTEESQPLICSIKAEANIEETNYSKTVHQELCDFTKYWFCDTKKDDFKKAGDCGRVSSAVAFLRSNPDIKESLQSVASLNEDQAADTTLADTSSTESTSSVRLKPTKVYTRPLFTVRSLAHKNLIKSEENNIYIDVLNSRARITESGWINVCRICHGGESSGDLLAPCQCRGSIALAHLECLERWLKESTNSKCELCQHHFHIIRQPKYGILQSIFVFLRHPEEHLHELLFDLVAFIIYTPAAIVSTYMLMLLCESIAKHSSEYNKSATAHVMTLAAVVGMAAIDFTYSSWFMVNMQKHMIAWRNWYRNNCVVKVVLPERKLNRRRTALNMLENELD